MWFTIKNLSIMDDLIFPVYEFRPLPTNRKLLRYNDGNWIEDDGQYDICFITDDIGTPFCYYIKLPYKKNLDWSWVKDGQWGAYVSSHPNGNAWHYQSKDGSKEIWDGWDRDKHPNIKVGSVGMDKVCAKNGCANGRGPDLFHIGDPYIAAGLVREIATKRKIKFPKIFNCIYCGSHDLSKIKMKEQAT